LSGEGESVQQRIERLVREGRKSEHDVQRVLTIWRNHLQSDIAMPDGRAARVSLDDLYHLMVDDRILRKPERITLILRGVFELRRARHERIRALSTWEEDGRQFYGFAIIEVDQSVRTMHVIDRRDLRKYRNEAVLWSQSEPPSRGMDRP
jgi:hypothetical protein